MMSYEGFWHVVRRRSWFAPWPQYVITLVLAVGLKAADVIVVKTAIAKTEKGYIMN